MTGGRGRVRARLVIEAARSLAAIGVVLMLQSVTIGPAVAQPAKPAATSHPLVPLCGACHGSDGNSRIAGTPSLAGQPKVFVENQLVLIREGLRDVPSMKGVLNDVKDEDLSALAAQFAAMPPRPSTEKIDAPRAARGADIAKRALCSSCHLPDYAGREQMPRLASQREDFLFDSMKAFRDGPPAGRDTLMTAALRGMSDDNLKDLAHYFATLALTAK